MAKVTIAPLGNPTTPSFVTNLNNAVQKLANEFDKVDYRDGTQSLTGNLNANSKRIYNLPAPSGQTEPIRLADVSLLVPSATYVPPTPPTVGNFTAVNRAAMAVLAYSNGIVCSLTEYGREGSFIFHTGDYTAKVALDPLQGIYVPPGVTTGASGCWIRCGVEVAYPEWFGAVGDGAADDTAAVQALQAFPEVSQIVLTGSYLITSDTSLSKDVLTAGGKFVVANGKTLTLLGTVSVPDVQVFSLQGTGKVVLSRTKNGAGFAEWWGATPDTGVDSLAALQAACDTLPTVQLSSGVYTTSGTLYISKNSTKLLGTSFTQTDQNTNDFGNATQIMCSSATATILQIGSSSTTRPSDLIEGIVIDGFSVNRSVLPFTPATGIAGCIGIDMRWAVNCHPNKVFSLNSCKGWSFYGCVSTFITYCSALRESEGSNSSNDVWIGFYTDGTAPTGYNGGNASLYFNYCRAFPLTEDYAPSLTYSAGFRMDAGWVDLFLTGFECGAGVQVGIDGYGSGIGVTDFKTEDLQIISPVLDPGSIANIRLQNTGIQSAVTILGGYVSPNPTTGTAIILSALQGSTTISGVQGITGSFGGTGVSALSSNNVKLSGNIWTGFRQPIYIGSCFNIKVDDTINGQTSTGDYPAIKIDTTNRAIVTASVSGPSAAYTQGLYLLNSSYVNVDPTLINPSSVGGASNKVRFNSTNVTAVGVFNTNCNLYGVPN